MTQSVLATEASGNGTAAKTGTSRAAAVLQGARVLIIEDDHLALRTLDRTLKNQGATVIAAHGLREGQDAIARDDYDAAVVDLRLDEGCGATLVSALRVREQPVSALIITGSQGTDAAREALASGADDLLLKPFDVRAFLDAVARTVLKTRAWRERLTVARTQPSNAPQTHQGGNVLREERPEPITAAPEADAAVESADLAAQTATSDLQLGEDEAEHPRRPKMIGWPPLPTLGRLDIEACADELMRLGDLSMKERRVLVHLLLGHQNVEIAADMGAKERTIKFHVSNVLKKLRVTSRGDLVRFFF